MAAAFEEPGYHSVAEDGNKISDSGNYMERIVKLMGKMQSLGLPPPNILGPGKLMYLIFN